jgi:hypothetical protein
MKLATISFPALVIALSIALPPMAMATPIRRQSDNVEAGSAQGAQGWSVNLPGSPASPINASGGAAFPNPGLVIPSIVAQLDMDNLAAKSVPEPISLILVGSGLTAIALLARKRR